MGVDHMEQTGDDLPRVVDILRTLIGFRTICEGTNEDLIDWVASFLQSAGCRVTVVPGERAGAKSLFASIGPERAGGLILSAHSDVVPVEGQAWHTDPFVLSRDGNRLYGRGTSDMKGFLACMLRTAEKAQSRALERPLHLAVSYDEEIGCVGVRSLLSAIGAAGPEAAGVIVGEPTEMRTALAHKGKIAFRVTCRGIAGHSANPSNGVNAIAVAARMVCALDRLQADIIRTETHDSRFEVPHSTVQVGLIEGGTALNIIPDRCAILAEIRLLPDRDGADYLAVLHRAAEGLMRDYPGSAIEIEVVNAYPGLNSDVRNPVSQFTLNRMRQNEASVVGFGTEAGLYAEKLGIPCVICGPGSIDRAHKADEFITVEELAQGERLLDDVLDLLSR